MTMKPWPQVDDDDPKVAAWRQAVEERIDAGFKSVLDELGEVKAAIEARRSFVDLAVHALDAPNTKYVLGFLALVVVLFAGSGIALSWGDLHIGKDAAVASEADADVDM